MAVSDHIRRLREKVGHDLLLLPGVSAIVLDEQGRVLMIRRADNKEWGLPAGSLEPGEHPAEAVIREVFEETGVVVRPTRVLALYIVPQLSYPNGDRAAYVSSLFLCERIGGSPRPDGEESLEVAYHDPESEAVLTQLRRVPASLDELLASPTATFAWDEAWIRALDGTG